MFIGHITYTMNNINMIIWSGFVLFLLHFMNSSTRSNKMRLCFLIWDGFIYVISSCYFVSLLKEHTNMIMWKAPFLKLNCVHIFKTMNHNYIYIIIHYQTNLEWRFKPNMQIYLLLNAQIYSFFLKTSISLSNFRLKMYESMYGRSSNIKSVLVT